jgi:putative membrane protein
MMRAAATGLLEVRASRLAVVRSRSPNVQKLATRYVMDHTAANAELTRLANRWRVELPIAAPRAERRQLEELGKQQGADFDHAFIQVMGLDAHNDAIDRFEDARRSVRQHELRAWLDRTLAVMRHHLQLARHAASGRSAD